ncbi:hypothetical protein [Sphingomonas mollis]|uniref:Uncharacterized protein n=1 Tax=Sphingomonas mollis TaxID=2795726 RepID=A0ABS0XLI6_9SPHN|nr:hypothetical protein [Sphingomonas sp. BT553]MBJ6120896.1 hypothetical protein [Sphingomonas sp. BT553]
MTQEATYTMEHHMRVYDDKHGWYVTIRPDRDGAGAYEIAWNDGDDQVKDGRTVVMPWAMARLMASAILNTSPPLPDTGLQA